MSGVDEIDVDVTSAAMGPCGAATVHVAPPSKVAECGGPAIQIQQRTPAVFGVEEVHAEREVEQAP